MTISVLQEVKADDSFVSGTTQASPPLTSAATLGSTIEVWVTGGSVAPGSVVDSASQTYTMQRFTFDGGAGQGLSLWTKANNGSATALVVTATFGLNQSGKGVWVKEIGGATLTGFDISVPIATVVNPGTGANAIATTSATPTNAPALCSSLAMECSTGNGSDLAAGTGYTLGTTGWAFGGANVLAKSSSKRITSAVSTDATWTAATNGAAAQYLVGLAFYDEAAGAAAPTVQQQDDSAPSAGVKSAVRSDLIVNRLALIATLGVLPLLSQTWDASAPSSKQTVACFQQVNRLPLGIPAPPVSLLPQGAQTVDQSTPDLKKYNVFTEQPLNILVRGIPAPPSSLPLLAQTWDHSAPTGIKYQPQVDVPPNLLPLTTIVAPSLLPLGALTVDASAPLKRYDVSFDLFPNTLPLGTLPLFAQSIDASAPQRRSDIQVDVYPYPLTLVVAPLLPLGAQTVDASAPAVKYQPQVDVYSYPITLGIPAPNAGPPLPLSSATWDASAPAVKYQLQVDVYQRPITLGIPIPPALLPLGAQTVDASAPIVKWAVQVDFYANRLPLLSGVMPFIPLDTSQLQIKYAVQVDQPRRPLTLGIVPPPPGPRPLQLSDSAPAIKMQVFAELFPTTLYLPANTVLPALTFYGFENPLAFMSDFDVTVSFGAFVAPALLSEPGEDIMGGKIESNQYEIEYITSQLNLSYGAEVTIQGTVFTVLDVNMVDDGVFSRARLEGSPFINQAYAFETPDSFLTDFATLAVIVSTMQDANVIMSQPGQDIMGGRISSNQYEIEYATVELALAYGVLVNIRGDVYKVIQVYPLDDGVFSRAKLEST